jgi:hypothetical protein
MRQVLITGGSNKGQHGWFHAFMFWNLPMALIELSNGMVECIGLNQFVFTTSPSTDLDADYK